MLISDLGTPCSKLTIKDNNDVIVANPERRNYSIKGTWRYEV